VSLEHLIRAIEEGKVIVADHAYPRRRRPTALGQ
jgi:hypothetical protein